MPDMNDVLSYRLTCSHCHYSLNGLNRNGTCPECGQLISASVEVARYRSRPFPPSARQAMVAALLGFVFPPFGIAALVLGRVAINEIDKFPDKYRGRSMAAAARGLGAVETILTSVLVIAALTLPMMNTARCCGGRRARNSTQLRGIHQQLVVFAQSNKNWFPGLTRTGVVNGQAARSNRDGALGRLKREDFYTEEYLVSPGEMDAAINGVSVKGVATSTGSFAVLEYANPKNFLATPTTLGKLEWRESLRTTAIVLSDREVTTDNKKPRSVWSSVAGQWHGSVLFNDNHVQFELTDKGYNGQYGQLHGTMGTGSINNLFDFNAGNGRMTSD